MADGENSGEAALCQKPRNLNWRGRWPLVSVEKAAMLSRHWRLWLPSLPGLPPEDHFFRGIGVGFC